MADSADSDVILILSDDDNSCRSSTSPVKRRADVSKNARLRNDLESSPSVKEDATRRGNNPRAKIIDVDASIDLDDDDIDGESSSSS